MMMVVMMMVVVIIVVVVIVIVIVIVVVIVVVVARRKFRERVSWKISCFLDRGGKKVEIKCCLSWLMIWRIGFGQISL